MQLPVSDLTNNWVSKAHTVEKRCIHVWAAVCQCTCASQ